MNRRHVLGVVLAALLLVVSPAAAQKTAAPASPAGAWEGVLKVPGGQLRMVLHLAKAGGAWTGSLDSPDQGAQGIAATAVKIAGRAVRVEVGSVSGVYAGTLSADGRRLRGSWTQGATFPLDLTRATEKPAAPRAKPAFAPSAVAGIWEGTLRLPNSLQLRLVLHLRVDGGKLTGTMDSPDQGAKGIPITGASIAGRVVTVEVGSIRGSYSGTLSPDGKKLTGAWTQAGRLPLELVRVEKVTDVNRPQTPKPPFPYRSDEVEFDNPKASGVHLGGTLTVPPGDGPFPCAVFITGSGPQDRDEMIFQHRPFAVLADDLARRGIASLRCDDRGVGKSKGPLAEATSADFATDIAAAVAYVRTRKEIDPERVGLIGHSEGGLIAPMLAADPAQKIAFVVLLAGPGVPGDAILVEQSGLIVKASGAPDAIVQMARKSNAQLMQVARDEKDPKARRAKLDTLAQSIAPGAGEQMRGQMAMLASPWMHFFLNFDPRPTLAKVTCPVLALNGEKDLQVAPAQSLPEIAKALKAGGNADVTTVEMPGLNHLFQSAKTGGPAEYGQIEETIAPAVLKTVGEWIVARTRR